MEKSWNFVSPEKVGTLCESNNFFCYTWRHPNLIRQSPLGPVYTERQRQRCDTALVENNSVAPKWVATPFWSDSIVFNQSSIASIITALTLMLRVNGPLKFNIVSMVTDTLMGKIDCICIDSVHPSVRQNDPRWHSPKRWRRWYV